MVLYLHVKPSDIFGTQHGRFPWSIKLFSSSLFYNPQAQQFASSMCGSPENSCQSSVQTGQTGYYGSTASLHKSQMPSPPYTPYDQSPQQAPQFVDPGFVGTSFQDYQGFTPDPMTSVASTAAYTPQYSPPQQQNVSYGQFIQQCPLPTTQGLPVPNQLQSCNVNPYSFAMQATVFTTSPTSSTLCYQPPNLTDLQFPAEPQVYNMMPSDATSAGGVDRAYVTNARERYNRVACAAPSAHAGTKRARENPSTQARGISDWSSQWLQGAAPPAHVY